MPRAAHCIDNGPMEGFRSILKRECYYGKRFTSKQALIQTCEKLLLFLQEKIGKQRVVEKAGDASGIML